jgi:hypothetical protein
MGLVGQHISRQALHTVLVCKGCGGQSHLQAHAHMCQHSRLGVLSQELQVC